MALKKVNFAHGLDQLGKSKPPWLRKCIEEGQLSHELHQLGKSKPPWLRKSDDVTDEAYAYSL